MRPLSRLAASGLSKNPPSNHLTVLGRFASTLPFRDRDDDHKPGEFRTLDLNPVRKERRKFEERRGHTHQELLPPRSKRMHVDQNWTNVWPSAATFKAAAVPLPVRMGRNIGDQPPLDKYVSVELMKIPNFLHLTPNHIKQQCAAIKKFCTPWPSELATDNTCRGHFPVQVIASDYLHSGQNIRNTKSRIVSMKVPLASLDFDDRSKDKFLRLIGNRYDPKTDMVTLITDRCPTRKQNYEYACYLITALYFESKKVEPWEHEKTEADFENYIWEGSQSEAVTTELVQKMAKIVGRPGSDTESHEQGSEAVPSKEEVKRLKVVQEYESAVSELLNVGEDLHSIDKYKASVKNLLGLSSMI